MKMYSIHRTSKQTSVFLLVDRNLTGCPVLPLGWIVPDGTNRTLEELKDKKISNDQSPGGGQAGAVVMTLSRLEPYFGTQFFLVDLGNRRNVRIHPATVEASWVVLFQ